MTTSAAPPAPARHVARTIVVGALAFLAGLVATALARTLAPGAYVELMPVLCLLIALEAIYSRSAVRRMLESERWKYRLAEWLALLVLIKLLLLALDGFNNLPALVSAWMSNFMLFFLDLRYVLLLIAVALVWNVCTRLLDDLDQLEPADPEAAPLITHEHFVTRVLGFCLITGLIAGAAALAATLDGGVHQAADPSGPLFLYFVVSLALVGHTRMAVSLRLWRREGTPVEPNLAPRWLLYALGLVGFTAVSVLALPLGQSKSALQSLSETLQLIINTIGYIIILIVQLVTLGVQYFLFILDLALSLLFGRPAPTPPAPPPPPPPPVVTPQEPLLDPAIGEIVRLIAGGLVVVAIIAALIYLLARRAPVAVDATGARALVAQIRALLAHLWAWITHGLRRVGRPEDASTATIGPGESAQSQAQGGRRTRQMSARERVRRYYALLLQRGARSGVPRQQSQTPSEYARTLAEQAPDAAEDVEQMTQAFVEARYSTHDVTDQQVSAVGAWFAHIRRSLQSRRRPK